MNLKWVNLQIFKSKDKFVYFVFRPDRISSLCVSSTDMASYLLLSFFISFLSGTPKNTKTKLPKNAAPLD